MLDYKEQPCEGFVFATTPLLENETIQHILYKPGISTDWVHISDRRRVNRPRPVIRDRCGRQPPQKRRSGARRTFVEQLYRYEE
jgi:hypothetical protein